VLDRTPGDQISLTADINGSKTQYTLDPSDQEKISLDEGMNRYVFVAADLAGNKGAAPAGEVYYLPGPLTIEIVKPSEFRHDDVPPFPGSAGLELETVRIRIDDGIGNVPETILYCRINGANLKKKNDYVYEGRVKVARGENNFLLEVEDIAGNRETKTFTISINRY
jgi:hypothetical protein